MFDINQTKNLWMSGFVNRWHSNFDHRLRMAHDMNGGHCSRVAILYLGVCSQNQSSSQMLDDLLTAVLHDAPEQISGDIPSPAKGAIPNLRKADKECEALYWGALQGNNYSQKSPAIALCDLLDAVLFVKFHAPDLLERDDWKRDVAACYKMAQDLGDDVLRKVSNLILSNWSKDC